METNECSIRNCGECEEICEIMAIEVKKRLDRIRENKTEREIALKELDVLFPGAGFLKEHKKSKGVIRIDGEWVGVY